jgi:hypothetical protein
MDGKPIGERLRIYLLFYRGKLQLSYKLSQPEQCTRIFIRALKGL